MNAYTACTVEDGFGPFDDGIDQCWERRRYRYTFATEEAAERFAESRYEERVGRLMKSQPDWWQSYWCRVVPVTVQPRTGVTWYSVYQSIDGADHDADFEGWATRDAAINAAKGYMPHAATPESCVFIVPVPDQWCAERTGDDTREPWCLWDDLPKIPAAQVEFLHGNPADHVTA